VPTPPPRVDVAAPSAYRRSMVRGSDSIVALAGLQGRSLAAVRVERFFWEGEEDPTATGPLVLQLADTVIELRGGPSGGDWLEAERRAELPDLGRPLQGWAYRTLPEAAELVGGEVSSVVPLMNRFGHVAGVRLIVGASALTFLSQADEHHVLVGSDAAVLRELGFTPAIVPLG